MNFHMEGECTWWAYVLLTEQIGNHRVNLVDHFVQGACVAGVAKGPVFRWLELDL